MGIELKNWMQVLRQVAELPKPSDLGEPPSNDEVVTLVTAFNDAVLRLFNNSMRACGIEVGDATSESNSVLISRRIGQELGEDVTTGLVKTRKQLLERLEAEKGDLDAEADRLKLSVDAAENEAKTLKATYAEKRKRLDNIAAQIRELKELTQ